MIKFNAGELSKALSFLWQAYKSKTTMDIMQNVKIDTGENSVLLTYTNGEQQLTHTIPAEFKEPQSFTVELKKLRDRVSQYDKSLEVKIKYDSEKNKANVSCGRSKITINGRPSDEYPSSESMGDITVVVFDGTELKTALAKVKVAQAVNDVRPYMNGVYFEFEGNKCSVVATDGHRMHVCQLPVDNEDNRACILPQQSIAPIHKFLDSGNVSVGISENALKISDEESSIQTRLLENKFPNWQRVVPQQHKGELTFNTVEVSNAIKGSLITSNEKFKGVRLIANNEGAAVKSSSPDGTSSEEFIECSITGIESIEFGVNGNYVLDALSSIDDSNVTLLVNDANSSMLIKENGYMAVVMPMRL